MERICIPDAEFAQRAKNVQKLMAEQQIDVLFAFGNEAEPQFVRYLSNYWPSFETAGVLIGQAGEPILLIGPETMTYASDRSKIADIRRVKCLRESSNPDYPGHKLSTLEEAIESVTRGKVARAAIAGFNIVPKIVYDDFASALLSSGCNDIVRGDELMMQLRMVKSPAELACLRKAGEITTKAMHFMLENIKPGMSEAQVRGLGLQAIFENGGESEAYPFWAMAGEGSNQAISRARSKIIQKQDYVHMAVGARYEGYVASVNRGVFFGEPDKAMVKAIKAAYEAQQVIMAQLYAGNNAGNVAKAYVASLEKNGYADNMLYGPCHASGLMEGEPPWIETDSDYLLKENMCYCTDIFLGFPNGYGLRVEDSVIVGKTGCEDFTNFPREIFQK